MNSILNNKRRIRNCLWPLILAHIRKKVPKACKTVTIVCAKGVRSSFPMTGRNPDPIFSFYADPDLDIENIVVLCKELLKLEPLKKLFYLYFCDGNGTFFSSWIRKGVTLDSGSAIASGKLCGSGSRPAMLANGSLTLNRKIRWWWCVAWIEMVPSLDTSALSNRSHRAVIYDTTYMYTLSSYLQLIITPLAIVSIHCMH
jgi:hypothetical protein